MAAKGNNRFALFADDSDQSSPESAKKITAVSSNHPIGLDSSPFNDNSWQEVKPRGLYNKKAKEPGFGDENRPPAPPRGRAIPNHRGRKTSNEMNPPSSPPDYDKSFNPHENWCGVCNVRYPSKIALQNHVKQSPNHQHYCNLCKRVFKDRNGLQNHVDHALGHDVFCNLCLSAFNDKWGLRNHFENNYTVGHEFACLTCLEGFRSREQMNLHLRTAVKHVWCNICNLKFRNQDERDIHWMDTNKHKHCLQPGCDFDAQDAAGLENHIKDDHFQCEGCHAVFISHTRLNVHLETCRQVQCEGCNALFPDQDNLLTHQNSCFKCDDCDFWTASNEEYLDHIIMHTFDVSCFLCDTRFQSQTHMIKHLETGKCAKLPDPCILLKALGKSWHSPLYMDCGIHRQIFDGMPRSELKELTSWMKEGAVRPYLCRAEGCKKTFNRLSSLVYHFENENCEEWGVQRLRLDLLEEFVIKWLNWKGPA